MSDELKAGSAHPLSHVWADAWHAWHENRRWAARESLAKVMDTRPTPSPAMIALGELEASGYKSVRKRAAIIREELEAALASAPKADAGLVEGQSVSYVGHGCNFEAEVINPSVEGWVTVCFRHDGSEATVRPSHLKATRHD